MIPKIKIKPYQTPQDVINDIRNRNQNRESYNRPFLILSRGNKKHIVRELYLNGYLKDSI